MRVIEQARLWFREGTSDKLYEIDLVEVAPDQYVVNFRFGRRGTPLRDGTKTAVPVSLARAKALFDKLVVEKTAGGYRPLGAEPAPSGNGGAQREDAREIITRLQRGFRGRSPVPEVWRAAARDLVEAEPALLELLASARTSRPAGLQLELAVWQHLLVSALVRCGTTAALPALDDIANDARARPHVRDMSKLAIARISPERGLALARAAIPENLLRHHEHGDAAALARAAELLLASDPGAARNAAVGLYLLEDDEVARTAVFAIARTARLATAEATVVRTLFRLAEQRRDGELYVLVARRIDAHDGTYRPFGPRTRAYFRRRVARELRRLGQADSPDYVMLATAVLLAYSDADAVAPRSSAHAGHAYGPFAPYHALNDILHGGTGTRFVRNHHGASAWRTRGVRLDRVGPRTSREERFPHLWDAAPAALWRILRHGRATPVAEFAVLAARANREYADTLPDEAIGDVLGAGHPLAQQLAFELARVRKTSTALARGALASDLPDAHTWILRWVASDADIVAADPELIALLVTGKTPAIREAALAVAHGRTIAPTVAASAAARTLSILLGLPAESAERASASVPVIVAVLGGALSTLGVDVLRDMIAHPLAALGELAGEIMLAHAHRDALPADLIQALLASPHSSVRSYGGRLIATMPPELAKDDPDALVLFATSTTAELREATRTLVGDVARQYPDVGRRIAERLVDMLLARQPEGVPAHVVSLLRAELSKVLPRKPAAQILALVRALSPHAREAGGLLLGQLGPDELELEDIVRLAHHEILAIREGAWTLARAALPRFRIAQAALGRLVDSPWEDTRAFAMRLVDDFGPLGADAIIAICDSIRPEVQALGKRLLLERFQSADAGTYLVRLAEHPSVDMQLLVSGMLEHHVAGNLERIRVLSPYLVTVLSQVNRGRVAKERVIRLLRQEAARSIDHARTIAPILERQSATIAITQKHPLIATMVDVKTAFPDVALPITIVPPEAD